MSKVMNKVKDTMKKGKDFVVEHKDVIYCGAVSIGIIGVTVAYSAIKTKKYTNMWRTAKEALDKGDMTADFGPYKIIDFLEPKTMKSLGRTLCHESTCEEFLKLK